MRRAAMPSGENWADYTEAEERDGAWANASSCRASATSDPKLSTLLQHVGMSVEQLCAAREQLVREGGPVSNKPMRPHQIPIFKDVMRDVVGMQPTFSHQYLRAAKVVIGRWLRPSEMKPIFGDLSIWRKRFYLTPLGNSDPAVFVGRDPESGRTNARVSYVIGKAGARLNYVTRKSGVLYIWFGVNADDGRAIVSIYADAADRGTAAVKMGRAAKLLAEMSGAFDANGLKGFRLVSGKDHMALRKVAMKEMYTSITGADGAVSK